MTSVVAAIVALGAGSIVAAFLYFKRSAEFLWDLALLRLLWFALLIYAVLAPYGTREVTEVVKPHISLYLDASSSLRANADSLGRWCVERLQEKGYEVQLRDFNQDALPEHSEWAYAGDGHIATVYDHKPEFIALGPSHKLLDKPLIQGAIHPKEVVQNSSFSLDILADPEADLSVRFQNTIYRGRSLTLSAGTSLGDQHIEIVARKEKKTDTYETTVQIKESLANVYVVSSAPHPHSGMTHRIGRELGIKVIDIQWKDVKDMKSWEGPIVAIGGGSPVLANLVNKTAVPILHLGAGPVSSYPKKSQVELPQLESSVALKTKKGPIRIENRQAFIEAAGIHWYASALENPRALKAFTGLVKSLLDMYDPVRLQVTHPERGYLGEVFEVVAVATNGLGEPVDAAINMNVFREDTLVETLTNKSAEGPEFRADLRLNSPGGYSMVCEANFKDLKLIQKSSIQIQQIDVERVMPFNESLFGSWKSRGTRSLTNSTRMVTGPTISYTKKNPQHLHWWYWGLVLTFAALEWYLRRNKGLI